MKKVQKLIGVLFVFALVVTLSNQVSAQVVESGDASARIITALTVTYNPASPLDFGSIVANNGGGVIISADAAGTRSLAASSTCELVGPNSGSATFDIAGEPTFLVDVSVDATTTLTETVGGVATMNVSLALSNSVVTLSGTGDATVFVGGQLTVAANQAVGTYTGTFDVTASYQ